MDESFVYLLAFGSNLGDRRENLSRGFRYLKERVVFLRESTWKETAPLASTQYDVSSHEFYLNAMCEIKTNLPPSKVYNEIQCIEDEVGHSRIQKWEPRHLDIDILFCGVGTKIETSIPFFVHNSLDGFFIPHAEFWERDFLIDFLDELSIPREGLKRFKNELNYFERQV